MRLRSTELYELEDALQRSPLLRLVALAFFAALLFTLGVASAVAQGDQGEGADTLWEAGFLQPGVISVSDLTLLYEQAVPVEDERSADSFAAKNLPHSDLSRAEAEELFVEVFGETLEGSARFFDGLEIGAFRSDYVAVVAPPQPDANPTLLSSLLPLRVENEKGDKEVVDLNLESGEEHLESSNPIVPVEIPSKLSEGIVFPEVGIRIDIGTGEFDRQASEVGAATAFFPNIREDSDFIASAIPTGVETFTQLRSPDAPTSEVFNFDLPSGAELQPTPWGARVVDASGVTILTVSAPFAIDAEEQSIPVNVHATDDGRVVVSVDPPADTAYPVLVDPMIESYYWALNEHTQGIGDWTAATNSSKFEARSYGYGGAEKGLNIYSYAGVVQAGAQANWNYHVPRYDSDYTGYGQRPSSFISKMTLTAMNWWIENESAPYKTNPFVMATLQDTINNKLISSAVRTGAEGPFLNASTTLNNPNENVGVKEGGVALHAAEDTQSRARHLWVGQATVEVSDKDYPMFASAQGPSKWINGNNGTPTDAVQFEVADAGLGIYSLLAKTPKLGGGINQWEQTVGCAGNASSPCPRTWKGGYWAFNPQLMPQGENTVELIGKDPIWHFSDQVGQQKLVKIKVDRTPPALALSGTLTEQASVGEWLPAYTLKIDSSDGSESAPQSGVAKVAIKVDNVLVDEANPGCGVKNCAIGRQWTMDVDEFAPGPHVVEIIATDGAGLVKSSTINIITHGDQTSPSLGISGSMTEQGSLGPARPTYKLKITATDPGPGSERKSGIAATLIKVDGTAVDSASPGCVSGGCSITREWVLNSNNYSVGVHNVEVKATDDAGRSTSKSLSISIERDTTPPALTLSGALPAAPEGWVQQEIKSTIAFATDANGYGVKQIKFSIDGTIVGQTAAQTCEVGACMAWEAFSVNMAAFDGGAHEAVVTAEDGAGNRRNKIWTVNVDPSGVISASEVQDTLEAVEQTAAETTELTPVDALVTPGQSGGDKPAPDLIEASSGLESQGGPTPITISSEPAQGFTVATVAESEQDLLHKATIEAVPLDLGSEASEAETINDSSAVISNAGNHVDMILRPAFDGLMAFQDIRDSTAPESYSWEVLLAPDESLKILNDQHAAIFWEDGTQAMLIAAQSAHGADGTAVSTSLSVSEGNVLTLTVHHRMPGVVYPVVAGIGWLGGFMTESVEFQVPAEEPELTFETFTQQLVTSPPHVVLMESNDPDEGSASASSTTFKFYKEFGARQCEKGTEPILTGCAIWEQKLKGFFWFNYRKVWETREPKCPNEGSPVVSVNNPSVCAWVGPSWQKYGGGHHITAQVLYDITYAKIAVTKEKHLSVYAYGSGYWNDHDTDCVCNPLPAD